MGSWSIREVAGAPFRHKGGGAGKIDSAIVGIKGVVALEDGGTGKIDPTIKIIKHAAVAVEAGINAGVRFTFGTATGSVGIGLACGSAGGERDRPCDPGPGQAGCARCRRLGAAWAGKSQKRETQPHAPPHNFDERAAIAFLSGIGHDLSPLLR